MLNKVYNEERTEIEKNQALSLKNQNKMDLIERADSSSSEESDSEEKSYDSADSINFGVPDRLKKKTKKDRKRQVAHRERIEQANLKKEGKLINKQVD